MSLNAVFEPDRVALVGASAEPGSMGALLWENLAGFDGEVVPVSRSAGSVGGVPAYRSLADVEGPIDLVVVAVPAAAVPEVARQAADKGVGAMVVLSGGFAETGAAGAELQAELARAAGATRVVGPNCFGVQNAARGLNASIAATPDGRPGGIALVTQSGAYGMALHAMAADEQLGFGKILATGNQVDVADHEVVDHLGADPATEVVCLFAESVADGEALAAVIRATTPHKPVIVAKTGRSAAGARAARSHTGSLATDDVVFRAAMRQAGAVLARSGLEMLDTARLLAGQPLPGGRRAAIVTNSGGTGVELADLLADEGVGVPELSAELQGLLADGLPALASARNPVDMTPVWGRFAELYPWLVDVLARSGEVDIVVPVLVQRAAEDEATLHALRDAVEKLGADGIDVPVCCCWVGRHRARPAAGILQAAGVPCLEWPERTARAVGHAVRYARTRAELVPAAAPPAPGPRLGPGSLDPVVASTLLAGFGIAVVETVRCDSEQDVVAAGRRIGGPVVVKAADPTIAHRTDRTGVVVGVVGDESLAAAYEHLSRLGPSVLVQPLVAGVEMAVGGLADPDFGPVVMVATGGTAMEVLDDTAFALAPVGADEALALIRGLAGAPLLSGWRGAEPADVDALAAVVVGVSRMLASHREVIEIDLNPVLVSGKGAVAVDWKVTVGDTPGGGEERPS